MNNAGPMGSAFVYVHGLLCETGGALVTWASPFLVLGRVWVGGTPAQDMRIWTGSTPAVEKRELAVCLDLGQSRTGVPVQIALDRKTERSARGL